MDFEQIAMDLNKAIIRAYRRKQAIVDVTTHSIEMESFDNDRRNSASSRGESEADDVSP